MNSISLPSSLSRSRCRELAVEASQPKLFIGAISNLTGLSIDTIRYYEKQKLLQMPPRSASGYRLYGPDELRALRFITRAQRLGFSLKEIRQLLDIQRNPGGGCGRTARVIEKKLSQVRAKVKNLNEIEYYLAAALGKCNRTLKETNKSSSHCPVLDELAS